MADILTSRCFNLTVERPRYFLDKPYCPRYFQMHPSFNWKMIKFSFTLIILKAHIEN